MKINQLKYGVIFSYLSLFVTNISNLILTPFIIKNLGQSEYGLYMLIGAFVGYIAILDFGLGNATTRFVAKYRAESDKQGEENFLASTLIIYMLISVIIFLIGLIVYFNLDNIFATSLTVNEIEIAKVMFLILVISLSITLPINLFLGIIKGYEKFIMPRIITISRTVLRTLLIIIFLSIGSSAISIVLIDAFFNIFMMMCYMLYVFKKLNVKFHLYKFDFTLIKEIFSYSSLIFISVIVDQIYWRIGHLILGLVASTNEVAIFSIGMLFGQYFITFSTAISGVFLPKVTRMVVNNASGEELTNILIKTGRWQFLILGLVLSGFILFGKNFIFLWVGDGYVTSWTIALMVMIPLLVVLTQTIGISILQAKNMHGFRAISYLIISIINVYISFYLAKQFGSVGAALGTTLSLIFGNIIVMNIYYQYKVKLKIIKFYKEVYGKLLIPLICSMGIGIVLLCIPGSSWIIFILQVLLYFIIYSLLMWNLGINHTEKRLIVNEIKKIKKH